VSGRPPQLQLGLGSRFPVHLQAKPILKVTNRPISLGLEFPIHLAGVKADVSQPPLQLPHIASAVPFFVYPVGKARGPSFSGFHQLSFGFGSDDTVYLQSKLQLELPHGTIGALPKLTIDFPLIKTEILGPTLKLINVATGGPLFY